MATYYKWRKSSANYSALETGTASTIPGVSGSATLYGSVYYVKDNVNSLIVNGEFVLTQSHSLPEDVSPDRYFGSARKTQTVYRPSGYIEINTDGTLNAGHLRRYDINVTPGTSQGYVYSTSSSTYPNGGVSGSYYYDQFTSVTSPTNPSQISYPSTINSLSTKITWQPSTSNTSYPVSRYELSCSTNGGSSWQVVGTTTQTSYQFGISSPEVTQIQFRVRAMDTNSQYSNYVTGSNSTVHYVPANPPVLVLPDNAKLGDTITISWNSVQDATNYLLQRKVDDGEWTQIYSGANLNTTNLVDNLGISYQIAFNVGSNFTSEWSQEYRLNTYEKLIEMTYLGDDGNYMPLYPRTISSAVVNASDLINTVSLSGTYQGNGFETNSIALENSVDPKVAIITNSKQETTLVTNFNENNMTVKNSNNELGETYNYVIIGNNKNK